MRRIKERFLASSLVKAISRNKKTLILAAVLTAVCFTIAACLAADVFGGGGAFTLLGAPWIAAGVGSIIASYGVGTVASELRNISQDKRQMMLRVEEDRIKISQEKIKQPCFDEIDKLSKKIIDLHKVIGKYDGKILEEEDRTQLGRINNTLGKLSYNLLNIQTSLPLSVSPSLQMISLENVMKQINSSIREFAKVQQNISERNKKEMENLQILPRTQAIVIKRSTAFGIQHYYGTMTADQNIPMELVDNFQKSLRIPPIDIKIINMTSLEFHKYCIGNTFDYGSYKKDQVKNRHEMQRD